MRVCVLCVFVICLFVECVLSQPGSAPSIVLRADGVA